MRSGGFWQRKVNRTALMSSTALARDGEGPRPCAAGARCLVRQRGLEPPTVWSEARCSIRLSYCRIGSVRIYRGAGGVASRKALQMRGKCLDSRNPHLASSGRIDTDLHDERR